MQAQMPSDCLSAFRLDVIVCTGWRPCNRLAASRIGQQSADTGSLMKIELVKWSVRNGWSAAEREGKIPNGFETSVKPTLCRLFFRGKNKNLQGSGTYFPTRKEGSIRNSLTPRVLNILP